MSWNIAAESTAIIILSILWVYSRQSHFLPTLKNRLFQACFLSTFLAMASNILSTVFIENLHMVPLWLCWFVTTFYFIMTPLMGTIYFAYVVSVVSEVKKVSRAVLILWGVPAVIYFLMVFMNLKTHWFFTLNTNDGYIQGPLLSVTYIIFYFYCVSCCFLVIIEKKWLDPAIRNILAIFPIIAGVVIIVQQIFPDIILSGSAATCAMLIIYLYLQNKQISMDNLMVIPNRQEFLKTLELRLGREAGVPFAVIVMSIRNFKQVNDTYGQQRGDDFLRCIAASVKEAVKPSRAYRFNGDEIAILVDDSDKNHLEKIVAQLLDRMEQPWEIRGFSCVIKAVVGAIQYPGVAEDSETMINTIEYAISKAKEEQNINVCWCDAQMVGVVQRRNKIIELIREAVNGDGFEVHYQPIWSIEDRRFTMCESLLRMPNTPLGPIFPSEFIPVAEETGLIVEITYLVLHQVCSFLKDLLSQGAKMDCITVNFSSVQFSQKDLAAKVFSIIDEYQIPYGKIKIELTESVMVENPEVVEKFIEDIHMMGIQIGLDDFGTGYCNLASVFGLPLDVIKIDKSLLWSAMKNERSAIMMRNITKIVKELGMKVVSEGVETEEQEAFVEACGCNWIQGFLYARPMPAKEARQLLLVRK